ncbi:unnamed protein product [Brachionus calyciflorus]|uniref:HTH CENPB-type domain-containing protein n=1 Tax=Brachionus calyciflorus TaxID=104777 RepID=A0A813UQJ9_9BILA|nr:unnamed protein product [Brachionus calyciflorus]
MSKKRNFNVSFKLCVVNAYESLRNYTRVAKKFKIYRRSVRFWVKQKDRLLRISAKAGRFHLMHNRYIRFLDLERDLMNWINQSRNNGACVSGKCIQLKALNLARQSGLEHFRASKGWLVRFLNRNNLVLRGTTSKGRSLPSNCVETINTFIDKCQEDNANRPRSHIYNFDETSINLDSIDNYTYEVRGSNRVKVDTSGNEKNRISIGLCASADGTKLPLIIIVPRKTPFKNFDAPSHVHLVYKPKATFDSACVKYEFIQRILFLLRKTETETFNLKSPGYEQAIKWLSQIWAEFDSTIIKSSFDHCGITTNNSSDFHSSLRHILEQGLIKDFVDNDEGDNSLNAFERDYLEDDDLSEAGEELSEEEVVDESDADSLLRY